MSDEQVHALRAIFNDGDHALYFSGRDVIVMLTSMADEAKDHETMTGEFVNAKVMELVRLLAITCNEAEAMCPICIKDTVQN